MAGLRDGDVHEVPALVKVNCHSLANGDDVFIEPPHRRPQRYGRGKGDCLDYRFGGVLESGIDESGVDRNGCLCRRPKVQGHQPDLRRFAGLVVNHVLAIGRSRQQCPLPFAMRLPARRKS